MARAGLVARSSVFHFPAANSVSLMSAVKRTYLYVCAVCALRSGLPDLTTLCSVHTLALI